jgi:hypothetical protein
MPMALGQLGRIEEARAALEKAKARWGSGDLGGSRPKADLRSRRQTGRDWPEADCQLSRGEAESLPSKAMRHIVGCLCRQGDRHGLREPKLGLTLGLNANRVALRVGTSEAGPAALWTPESRTERLELGPASLLVAVGPVAPGPVLEMATKVLDVAIPQAVEERVEHAVDCWRFKANLLEVAGDSLGQLGPPVVERFIATGCGFPEVVEFGCKSP